MLVEYENALVLVTDSKIESIKEVLPILEQVTRKNQPLLIVSEDITGDLLSCPSFGLNLCIEDQTPQPAVFSHEQTQCCLLLLVPK
jgi:hypothetical protein